MNEDFINYKNQTRFGKLVKGTKYGDYAVNNAFLRDSDTFIEKKGSKARYYFTIIYKGKEFGVWCDFIEGKLWVTHSVDKDFRLKYAITMKDHQPNTMFLKNNKNRGHFKVFIENYKLGNVYFEDINIKNMWYEVIQMTLNC